MGVLYDQIRAIVLGTALLLVALGSINAFIVASFAAGTARGATRRSARSVARLSDGDLVVVSQLGACALAVLLGIAGLGLWSLMEGGDLPERASR